MVMGIGQPLNSSTTSYNKMFLICASTILPLKRKAHDPHLRPVTLAQGLEPPFRAQDHHLELRTLIQGAKLRAHDPNSDPMTLIWLPSP